MAKAETDVMCAFLSQLMPIDYNKVCLAQLNPIPPPHNVILQLSDECNGLADHTAKIHWTADQLLATGMVSDRADLEAAIESFWRKLVIADKYTPSSKLQSPTVRLFKASQGNAETDGLGEDYGLGTVCQETVNVYPVQGDHNTFILQPGVDTIVNILNKSL